MADIFEIPSLDGSTQQLADHLPRGRAWDKKNIPDSNSRKLITSLASAFNSVQGEINGLVNQLNINLATDLLPEWLESVGLPDGCESAFSSLAAQRTAVISRLRKVGIYTKAQFEQLALDLTGLTVTVTPGEEVVSGEKFIMYVSMSGAGSSFPLVFPVIFGVPGQDVIQCVFDALVPACVVVVIQIV